jgi:hypothetical protein
MPGSEQPDPLNEEEEERRLPTPANAWIEVPAERAPALWLK